MYLPFLAIHFWLYKLIRVRKLPNIQDKKTDDSCEVNVRMLEG